MAADRIALNAAAAGLERPSSRTARDRFRAATEGAPVRGYAFARESLASLRRALAAKMGGAGGWYWAHGTTAGMEALGAALASSSARARRSASRSLNQAEPCLRVVTTAREHRGGIGVFENTHGVSVQRLAPCATGEQTATELAAEARHADVLFFSAVTFDTGLVIPIAPLAEAARKHGALLICDAAQAVGQLPFTVDGLDACILSGGKWLGGPPASGALWLAPRLRELTLYRGGSPIDPSAGSLEPRGSWDFSGVPGLAAAVTEWNAERRPRRARLLALAARVRDALVRGGLVVLPGESACVTFLVPEPDRTVAALEELDVHVKAVETPEGRAVRVAPDPLTDESVAVSRLVAALRTVRVIQTRRVA